jgi:hypothetical protein
LPTASAGSVPGRNGLFILMLATIILPFQVTSSRATVYLQLGWVGTWLPLIIPHFFANAYNVFLLRQYFLSIPRELDEAAMIDGAGPFRILRSVIVPQAVPAIIAVTLFHFFWAWNEYFLPLIYLQGKPDLQPRPSVWPGSTPHAAVDAHPGRRFSGNMLLPSCSSSPSGLHAGRGLGGEGWPSDPGAGLVPPDGAADPVPRPRRHADDRRRPVAGVPTGGSGGQHGRRVGRLRPLAPALGVHHFEPVAVDGFRRDQYKRPPRSSVRRRRHRAGAPTCPSAPGHTSSCSRAWFEYCVPGRPLRTPRSSLPVVPGDDAVASLPVGVFEWAIGN